ncbi:hypothetical protein [Hydrogenophaga sp.]|uniref:hypothetical protein n=1 Tax=Hydrogenophaga sp. TaxID=1904254 RepID=UPI0027308502|nr:hypothetical protein [Hydrogenophaga sp.]MDP2018978.1 hypothetical protein [Hydrogenophaga sp.]MDP3164356.1 hypothetical protein [Hydrogenophaga sp.]
MNPLVTTLGVLLAVSTAGNALLGHMLLEARETASAAESQRDGAQETARLCSEGTAKIMEAVRVEREVHKTELEQARAARQGKQGNAQHEIYRPPAVAGDDCASALVENREWLQRRKAGR